MRVHECVSFILVKDAQILLETRARDKETDPGAIAIPGGHMDLGEDQKQTLFRELKEELNAIPQSYVYLCSLYHPTTELQLIHYYIVTEWEGNLECYEAESVDWYTPNDPPVATEVDRIALKEFRRLKDTFSSI
ncbi:NUDIX hydrolase [Vibrio sp. EA2]|uniref:NUDIX hydrolase n=1 Tax=Vibrio sp. EA2 TaxID=3079860 RepID=UPI0029493F6F|nr:NUDIX domain-containing protein [Vibrio sp. EA2]MDV6249995.1 NUDIX domain-containing protein [Vibrio sp. EA2]